MGEVVDFVGRIRLPHLVEDAGDPTERVLTSGQRLLVLTMAVEEHAGDIVDIVDAERAANFFAQLSVEIRRGEFSRPEPAA